MFVKSYTKENKANGTDLRSEMAKTSDFIENYIKTELGMKKEKIEEPKESGIFDRFYYN